MNTATTVQTTTVYTIQTRWYDSRSIEVYLDRKEWKEAMDRTFSHAPCAGTGESFIVSIYETEDTDPQVDSWSGMSWHSASRDRHASVDSIPESWKLVDSQSVGYQDDDDDAAPSAYIYI